MWLCFWFFLIHINRFCFCSVIWQVNESSPQSPTFFSSSPQGVAHVQTEWLIFSGKNFLRRTTQNTSLDFQTLAINKSPLSEFDPTLNLDHLGDVDVGNSVLYVPIEDIFYTNPLFALFDLSSLLYTGLSIPATQQSHCPWVVSWNDILLSSEFDNVTHLFTYNSSSADPLPPIPIFNIPKSRFPFGLMAIQGGALLNDKQTLLLSSSDTSQPLFTLSLPNYPYFNEANLIGIQDMMTGGEPEGITTPPDGSLYSVLNYYDEPIITRYLPTETIR
jgi:hypothetical protein